MTIDRCRPKGARIMKLQIKSNSGQYENLDESKTYKVSTVKFVANGGDGYTMIKNERIKYEEGDLDTDVLQEYIKNQSPIEPSETNRITVLCSIKTATTGSIGNTIVCHDFVKLSLFFIFLILCLM